jgi:hypothetical protein
MEAGKRRLAGLTCADIEEQNSGVPRLCQFALNYIFTILLTSTFTYKLCLSAPI